MSIYSIPTLLGALFSAFIGLFVFLKNKKSPLNIAFGIFCLSLFGWLFGYTITYSTKSDMIAIIFTRLACTSVAFTAPAFHFLTAIYLQLKKEKKWVMLSYGLMLLQLPFFVSTEYFLQSPYKYFWGYYSKAGPLHPYHLMFFFAVFFRGYYLLLRHYKERAQLSSLEANRIKYIFIAYVVTALGTIDYLPKYGFEFYPFGFIFEIMFASIIAYAIFRYQLLDIEVIIRRALVFAGLLAMTAGAFIIGTVIIQDLLLKNFGLGGRIAGWFISGTIIITTIFPLRNFLVRITDRYLFQKRYDYRELLHTLSREVITIMDLDKLINMVVEDVVNIIRLESCAILLFDRDKDIYKVVSSKGLKDTAVTFTNDSPIITFLENTHIHILKGEYIEKMSDVNTVKEDMKKLGAELILPLVIHDELIGVLSLGMKKSGEEYNQDDIAVLESLAGTASVAISNAQYVVSTMQLEAEAAQREKMAVIGTLAAGINHEICNPLGIARGQCEVFLLNQREGLLKHKSKEELLHEAMKIMEKVIHEADRATAITKKLSSFAKPSKGEISEDVNIKAELDEVMALVGHEFSLEKIDVIFDIPENVPFITCDRKQLQQIIFNIVRNAGQAIGEKGVITVIAKEDKGKIRIDIKDTGAGIPKDKLTEIFNPFYTTKDPGKGTGLGLFIVRQLVERNKGRIWVESEVGRGTVFTLEFPVSAKVKI